MTTLVESPHFGLVHDPRHACLYATWYGPHDVPVTQANYELILLFVRLTRSTKLLNDGLLDQKGWQELTHWLAQDCFQRLTAEGLVAVAWVLPREPEVLCATRRLIAAIVEPLVETFDDPEAAYHWLHQWPTKTMPDATQRGGRTDSHK